MKFLYCLSRQTKIQQYLTSERLKPMDIQIKNFVRPCPLNSCAKLCKKYWFKKIRIFWSCKIKNCLKYWSQKTYRKTSLLNGQWSTTILFYFQFSKFSWPSDTPVNSECVSDSVVDWNRQILLKSNPALKIREKICPWSWAWVRDMDERTYILLHLWGRP